MTARTCPSCGAAGPFYASPRERKCKPCKSRQVVASQRAHGEAHRVRRQAAKAGQRARAEGERGIVSAAEWRGTLDAFAHTCAYCEQPESEVGALCLDHVYPLARGGPNDAANVVPACAGCNSRKRDLPPLTFWFCLDLPI